MMFRPVLILVLVSLAATSVPFTRTKKEIEEFKAYLDQSQVLTVDSRRNFYEGNADENSGKFQGDILLSDEQKESLINSFARGARNGYIVETRFWPDNVLVYDIQEDHFNDDQIAAIEAGVKDLGDVSCIQFRRRTEEDRNYVLVTGLSGGCYAHVGFQDRGVHSLNLQPNEIGVSCFRHGTIVHEFLHSLGFLHMHSTHNRDDWVNIVFDNVIPASAHNFYIYDSSTVSNYGTDYDFGSCLQYTEYAFTINGERTIVPLQPYDGVIGQRIGLSEIDKIKLNRLARCPGYEDNWEHN